MVQLFQERPVLGQERERGEENASYSTNEEEDSNIQTSNIARYESNRRVIRPRIGDRFRGDIESDIAGTIHCAESQSCLSRYQHA